MPPANHTCYLCGGVRLDARKGAVRDNPALGIVECADCGLVALNRRDHIAPDHYERSGMHGARPASIEAWLAESSRDDERRFNDLSALIANRRVLDVGSGAGGFLSRAQRIAKDAVGIEPEARVRQFHGDALSIYPDADAVRGRAFDLVTAFHVLEHVPDPRAVLRSLSELVAPGGRMVIEVPSSDDALLTLYDCGPFQGFTYWSQHLFLFNAETLRRVARQAGLRVVSIAQFQRYPLANHLHWLSQGRPGGHAAWSFLDTPSLRDAYGSALAAIGKCDTLIAHLEADAL